MNYAKTIGKDVNADGRPDIPLRFDVEDSTSAVQFPLGFCPGDKSDKSSPQINFKCIGEWGFVIKEWETIVKVFIRAFHILDIFPMIRSIYKVIISFRDTCRAPTTSTR